MVPAFNSYISIQFFGVLLNLMHQRGETLTYIVIYVISSIILFQGVTRALSLSLNILTLLI